MCAFCLCTKDMCLFLKSEVSRNNFLFFLTQKYLNKYCGIQLIRAETNLSANFCLQQVLIFFCPLQSGIVNQITNCE